MPREYRVCWNASSNISFRGATEWFPWEGDEDNTDEVIQDELARSSGTISQALEMALEGSGFDWWIETQEVNS